MSAAKSSLLYTRSARACFAINCYDKINNNKKNIFSAKIPSSFIFVSFRMYMYIILKCIFPIDCLCIQHFTSSQSLHRDLFPKIIIMEIYI